MARLFITRMLETLFRRKWLYAIPIVVALAFGVVTVLGAGTAYRSTGVVLISEQSVAAQLGVGSGNDFGVDTAAAYTARQINTVLATDAFLDIVIENAGVTDAIEAGALTRDDVRRSVGAGEVGDNLVSVSASTDNSELSWRLANGTIDAYKQWESGNLEDDSLAAVDLLTERIQNQQDIIEQLEASPVGGDSLDAAIEELSRLQGLLEQARTEARQSTDNVDSQFRLVDAPEQPTSPTSSRKEDVQTLVLFLILGGLVSSAAVVAGTLLDRSVRYGEEVELRLDVPVLATVPDSRAARAPLVV